MPWTGRDGEAVYRNTAYAWGENALTRQWEEYSLWGGFLTENWVQSVARDLLAEAMRRSDAEGILPVLTSHDEQVAEIIHADQAERMRQIMEDVPTWAHGIPIAVEGWVGSEYRK
jgi:DNA polymerase bacteriophage-type